MLGHHAALLLLARLGDWDPGDYWKEDHPAQVAFRAVVATGFDSPRRGCAPGIDGCGVQTYAFPLATIARAYALLADPDGDPAPRPARASRRHLPHVRDAMAAHPELVAGTRDRLDTSLMKAVPGPPRVKSGHRGAPRGIGMLPDRAERARRHPDWPSRSKMETGTSERTWAATVEALRQVRHPRGSGAPGARAGITGRRSLDPHGRLAGETVPAFELAPVGELTA